MNAGYTVIRTLPHHAASPQPSPNRRTEPRVHGSEINYVTPAPSQLADHKPPATPQQIKVFDVAIAVPYTEPDTATAGGRSGLEPHQLGRPTRVFYTEHDPGDRVRKRILIWRGGTRRSLRGWSGWWRGLVRPRPSKGQLPVPRVATMSPRQARPGRIRRSPPG